MPVGGGRITRMMWGMFRESDLYWTDPAQHVVPAGVGLDDISVDDLYIVFVRRVECLRDIVCTYVPTVGYSTMCGILSFTSRLLSERIELRSP